MPGLTNGSDQEAQTGELDTEIAQEVDAGNDDRIAERIEGIFAELPDFAGVNVSANEGVVTLGGALSDADAIARAENIAARVSGVVTVQNEIERDLSVEQNLSVLGELSGLTDSLITALPLFLVACAVALAFGFAGVLLSRATFIWDRIAPNPFLAELIGSAVKFVFILGGLVIGLDMIGAGALLGAVLGGAGVIGIALGFAMRDTIENYVASLMLSLRQPFRPNDHVLIDDLEGRVIRLTSRATILMTLEGNHLRVPNSQVFKAVILNFTRNPQRRFEFELGIDADDNPRAAMKLGRDTLDDLAFVLGDPEPTARVTQVGDSNIVIRFLGWVDQREADWNKSRSFAIAAVKDALEGGGFALPEPIYRLRFDGRTDPLPIGRSAKVAESAPEPASSTRSTASDDMEDVRPDSQISAMVENERRSDPEQSKDMLDTKRPIE
ncbi:mechanosensitive ion channel family protein [Erythrobacter crassostreae]|uniref:mechanosensitive ion channel family protein n=1 Tax=Erythrobacter crassostreae TaxID=2828328 RepID=UPI00210588B2|nr:mechanosensitive ion channel family protein [Erythrobacter crassostrea]